MMLCFHVSLIVYNLLPYSILTIITAGSQEEIICILQTRKLKFKQVNKSAHSPMAGPDSNSDTGDQNLYTLCPEKALGRQEGHTGPILLPSGFTIKHS